MSPEQCGPDRYGAPGPASDVWGLGATAVRGGRRLPGLRGRRVRRPGAAAGRHSGRGRQDPVRRPRDRPREPAAAARGRRGARAGARPAAVGPPRWRAADPLRTTTRRCPATGQGRCLGAVGHGQLGEDVGHVVLGGLRLMKSDAAISGLLRPAARHRGNGAATLPPDCLRTRRPAALPRPLRSSGRRRGPASCAQA